MSNIITAIEDFCAMVMRETTEIPMEIILPEKSWMIAYGEVTSYTRSDRVPQDFTFEMSVISGSVKVKMDPEAAARIRRRLLQNQEMFWMPPANEAFDPEKKVDPSEPAAIKLKLSE